MLPEEIEKQYKETQASLSQVNDDLKRYAEESQAAIKGARQLSDESKAKVDELLITQGELKARLEQAEQHMVALESGGSRAAAQSIGQMVAESDAYKGFNGRGSFQVPVQAAITEATGSGGDLITPDRVPGVVAPGEQRLTVRDLLSWGTTGSNSVEFVRETGFTNSAAPVSENPSGGKPESDLTFEAAAANVATIAHWVHASRQVLADAAMLQGYINGRLTYGLKLKEEAQLLKGSGVGLNIDGIYTQASAYANPGVVVQNETMIDRLRISMLQVQLAEYPADGIVVNPIDWAQIELTKTTDNAYLFASPVRLAGPTLWGLPVVSTQSLAQDEYLTGSFRMGAQGWDREQSSITVSTEDRDNFIKNMVTILCEERIALTVYRPEAFVKGDFSTLPS